MNHRGTFIHKETDEAARLRHRQDFGQHPGGAAWAGKHCVVLGSNNSAHDICADLWEHGADVTMIQRSSTHIAPSNSLMELALRDRIDVVVKALHFNPRFLGELLARIEAGEACAQGELFVAGKTRALVVQQDHAEGRGALGDEDADASKTDDAEHLAEELGPLEPGPLPSTGAQGCVRQGDVARLREQERHRVLGGRHDVALRSVHHHDATRSGSGDVDVVEADTCTAHHHQLLGGFEHRCCHLGGSEEHTSELQSH